MTENTNALPETTIAELIAQYERKISAAISASGKTMSDDDYNELRSYGLPIQLRLVETMRDTSLSFFQVVKAYDKGDF